MALDQTIQRSRRALLAGSIGALAAFVGQAIGRPLPARAEGEPIVVGGEYTDATSVTRIRNGTNNAAVLRGESVSGTGIYGLQQLEHRRLRLQQLEHGRLRLQQLEHRRLTATSSLGHRHLLASAARAPASTASSDSGLGVWGSSSASDKPEVVALSYGGNTGLLLVSGTVLPATPAKTGVYGYAVQDSGSRGLWGRANAGLGVYGHATSGRGIRGTAGSGKGGSFEATTGIALHAKGRVQLEQSSGTATIAAGTRSKTVTPGFDLTSSSKVLATLMGNPGGSAVVQRVAVDTIANSFRVYLTANAANKTKFAWLVLV
jgi:hypothetical protein